MNRTEKRARERLYRERMSKEQAKALINKRYRESIEHEAEERGIKQSLDLIMYMTAYTISYKLGLGKKRLPEIMYSILDNIDAYTTGHLDYNDYKTIQKEMNKLGFSTEEHYKKRKK